MKLKYTIVLPLLGKHHIFEVIPYPEIFPVPCPLIEINRTNLIEANSSCTKTKSAETTLNDIRPPIYVRGIQWDLETPKRALKTAISPLSRLSI